jgi:hypothetical protein
MKFAPIDILHRLNYLTIAIALIWIQFPPTQSVNPETNPTPTLPMGVTALTVIHFRSKRFMIAILKAE